MNSICQFDKPNAPCVDNTMPAIGPVTMPAIGCASTNKN
jgi:hypothetical protein